LPSAASCFLLRRRKKIEEKVKKKFRETQPHKQEGRHEEDCRPPRWLAHKRGVAEDLSHYHRKQPIRMGTRLMFIFTYFDEFDLIYRTILIL